MITSYFSRLHPFYAIGCTILLLLALPSCKSDFTKEQIPTKPNILLILTDDQGYPTLGSYGGNLVKTPHLDRLAKEGALFTDAYVTSQCTPTRASLLTGQYTARNQMWHVIGWYGYPWARVTESPFRENLSRETFTIGKGLKQAGYATAIFGKWHLTTNEDGHYMGLNPEAASHYGFDVAGPVLGQEVFAEGSDRGVKTLTDQALNFIEQHRDQPWFCYVSHHMIHGKVVAPDSLVNKYRKLGYGEEGPNRAVYLAGLELIDWSVGTLMAGLEKMGESRETLVVFVSDNGGIEERLDFRSTVYDQADRIPLKPDIQEYDNAPLRAGKGSVYEGGVRVPMILNWPDNITPGTKINTPAHIVDLAPTFFDLAGIEHPQPLDGLSLVHLLQGKQLNQFEERSIFQFYPFYDLLWGLTPCASIRKGDYKLIEFFGDRVDGQNVYRAGHQLELNNLKEDIGETNNLIQRQPQIASELKQSLDEWLEEMQVEIPTSNPHFEPLRALENTREKPSWLLE